MDAERKIPETSKLRPALLWTGAALPLLISLGVHAAGTAPQPVAPAPRPAGLAFDQYSVNLGPIPPMPYAFARFRFTNVGPETVHIRELKPSCGCLQPQLARRVYEPGESGDFHLRIQTANEKPGPKEETVRVIYEDPEPREVELTFKVVLPENQVVVRPGVLIFYQLGTEPTTQEIVVSDFRKQGLTVIGVESTSKLATAELGPVEQDSEGVHRTRVSVTVPAVVPPGAHHGTLVLTTNDPNYPQLIVPVRIQGRPPTPLAYPGRLTTGGLLRRNQ